ncbi:MAG: hypothetical protein IKD16_00815, partial [Bacteroidales bacterium]|nr:hypothetical protein [Bacteroidales bacterium]
RIAEYPATKSSMDKFLEKMNEASVSASVLTEPYGAFEKIYSSLKDFNGTKTYARMPLVYEFAY